MAVSTLIKDKIKEMLWRAGVRDTLPAGVINRVKILENGEKLINIAQDTSFFFTSDFAEGEILLREGVYERLKEVQKLLPPHYHLKVFSAYRSMAEQQRRWQRKIVSNRKLYPQMSEAELEQLTRGQVADPRRGGFGGHQTGGAVDLTLCDENGVEYDMGTPYSDNSEKIKTKCSKIALRQRRNREILKMCMEKAGFKNYPNEWWHYSYGDRMWGAYSRQRECVYGMVTEAV